MPLDWPRINQFPQWFTVSPDKMYEVIQDNSKNTRMISGKELAGGLSLTLEAGELVRIQLRERSEAMVGI
jgi:hypothetical protein